MISRYFLWATLVYFLGLGLFVYYDYTVSKSESLRNIDLKLEQIASSIPFVISDEEIRSLDEGDVPLSKEIVFMKRLNNFSKKNGITYSYVMKKVNNKIIFVACSATKDEIDKKEYSLYGDVYEDASKILKKTFTSKNTMFEQYADKWGVFRSAFVPWKSADGSTYVLGADVSVDYLNAVYMKKLWSSFGAGVFFFILAGPFVFAALASGKKAKRELEGEVLRQTKDIERLNAELEERVRYAESEASKATHALQEAENYRLQAEEASAKGAEEVARRLGGIVDVISTASEQLAQRISQSSAGAENQSERIVENVAAIEEMTNAINGVAGNSSESAASAEEALERAERGNEAVRAVVSAIETVQSVTISLKDDMSSLGKQAEEIGEIVDVISDIADQTNLLALNAAIEAARAGETGRGFAVVADEVRKLAEKTQVATKSVGNVVSSIQQYTRKSIQTVETTVDGIQKTTEEAGRSGKTLEEIVELVNNASDRIRAIATASEQQAHTTAEIRRSMDSVAAISNETVSFMYESTAAVDELTRQAAELQNVITEIRRA